MCLCPLVRGQSGTGAALQYCAWSPLHPSRAMSWWVRGGRDRWLLAVACGRGVAVWYGRKYVFQSAPSVILGHV